MNYNVPQFTDVEDKIIGTLTLKQFGIIFAGGGIVVALYSLTKSSIVLVFSILVFGLPTLIVAFYKFNGRSIYSNGLGYLTFFTKPRIYVFHKEAKEMFSSTAVESKAETEAIAEVNQEVDKTRLRDLYYKLETAAKTQERLLKK